MRHVYSIFEYDIKLIYVMAKLRHYLRISNFLMSEVVMQNGIYLRSEVNERSSGI